MTGPLDSGSSRFDAMEGTQPDRPLLSILMAHQRKAWRRGDRPLVEAYLRGHPLLEADTEAVLDLIYNEILLREERGESPALQDYTGRFPALATELALQFEVEHAIGLGRKSTADGLGGEGRVLVPKEPAPLRPDRIPGYEILGELGRGGMGVVYKARHVRLNRTVALKMILGAEHAGAEVYTRFLAEAEAVARLQHPNIIQIFGFDAHDGHPYIEMEYAEGGSLADRLARPGPLQPVLVAAELVECLARAVHEVHRVGIVHRDLKPANILLAADGTPKIADFGLAQARDAEARLTQTLRIVGSPSYMAPEQAGAGLGAVGPPADVYALGAILYQILTGRPPFLEATVLETLEQVRSAEPIEPGRLRPKLPRDLATICLKCLEKDPARRYASAIDLAEDLGRFRDGGPILARPVGGPERLWRWCRREPALAGLALALTAGLAGASTQWWRAEVHLAEARVQRGLAVENALRQVAANQALRKANEREQAARRRAQDRFDGAMKAVSRFEDITRDAALLREPRLGSTRARMLQSALDFYRELQASLEEDASTEARSQLSEAYARVAYITWELGLQEEALAAYRRSLALTERMSADEPADPEIRAALGLGHARIGFTLRTMGRPAEALRSYEQALAIQERLDLDHPGQFPYREPLSWTLSNLGVIHQELGDPALAARFHRQAIAIHQDLVDRDPSNARLRGELGWCWRHLCLALAATGDLDEARDLAGRAAGVYEDILRTNRDDVQSRWRLARCLDEIGRIHYQSGRHDEAAGPLERASGEFEVVARHNPVFYGVDAVRNRLYLAAQRELSGRSEEARADLREAEEARQRAPELRREGMFLDMACAYCLWSVAAQDGAIAPSEREGRARRAVAALRRSIAAGSCSLNQLHRNPILDPLRSRRDFQELVADLAFPVDPFEE